VVLIESRRSHIPTHTRTIRIEIGDSKKKIAAKKKEDTAKKNILGRTPFHGDRERESPYQHKKNIKKIFY
jgi:hypothetical protein